MGRGRATGRGASLSEARVTGHPTDVSTGGNVIYIKYIAVVLDNNGILVYNILIIYIIYNIIYIYYNIYIIYILY